MKNRAPDLGQDGRFFILHSSFYNEWSRLVEKVVKRACLAGSLRAVGLLIEGGEFARRRVFPHLAVPLIIGPAAEFSGDLRPLFQREPLDRRPDFLNGAHT